jgi:hypothetical protein
MSAHDEDRIRQLLKQALPPVETNEGPARDLWPAVLRRLDARPSAQLRSKWVWLDWALLAGLAVMTAAYPAAIPLLLYYL